MSDKQKKIALGVVIVVAVAYLGQAMGFWEMSLPFMAVEGPDAGI